MAAHPSPDDGSCFLAVDDLPEREIAPGFRARFVHSAAMTSAHVRAEPGAVLPEHAHPHEQITTVLEGTLELTVAGVTRALGPGMTAVIPSNVTHSGRAVTACRVLDVFHPVREEYR